MIVVVKRGGEQEGVSAYIHHFACNFFELLKYFKLVRAQDYSNLRKQILLDCNFFFPIDLVSLRYFFYVMHWYIVDFLYLRKKRRVNKILRYVMWSKLDSLIRNRMEFNKKSFEGSNVTGKIFVVSK